MMFTNHPSATCPDCGATLAYGTKDEASGFKVFYACRDCGWERMAGRISLTEVEHRDDADDRAREIGERWAGP